MNRRICLFISIPFSIACIILNGLFFAYNNSLFQVLGLLCLAFGICFLIFSFRGKKDE